MKPLEPLAIVDTETLGLDAQLHPIWEIAVITGDPYADDSGYAWTEHLWQMRPDLSKADPGALRVNKLYQRMAAAKNADPGDLWAVPHFHVDPNWIPGARQWRKPMEAAFEVATALAGRTLVGAVPNFDTERLEPWLRANGQCGAWNYHIVDIEALCSGFLAGQRSVWLQFETEPPSHLTNDDLLDLARPGWKSDALSEAIGVPKISDKDRHTALGDCRWGRDVYCKIMAI